MKQPAKKVRTQSVFRTIMLPLFLLLLLEMLLLVGGFAAGRVVPKLNANAEDILSKQVRNRATYLQNSMVNDWSELTVLSAKINQTTKEMVDDGILSLETLDSDSAACTPLLLNIYQDMISTMYAKKLSGVFVVFNTHDLAAEQASGSRQNKTGLSIRDGDPASPPSLFQADLLLERAPIDFVQQLHISTDSGWLPVFPFAAPDKHAYDDFLYQPIQAARNASSIRSASDFGYWSTQPYLLYGADKRAISYSIPLILDDGTIYGVLGVELLESYLREMLPTAELSDSKQGSYMLAVGEKQEGPVHFSPVLVNGATLQPYDWSNGLDLTPAANGTYSFALDGYTYYADVKYLSLYNSNTPFVGQNWALIGVMRTTELYAFSQQVMNLLMLVFLLTLVTGIFGSFFISGRLSGPIRKLYEEVNEAQRQQGGIPHLPPTGITEIDRFSGAITGLSQDVVDASTRFLRIMEMASVDLGGFELHSGEDKVFVTENFFPLLGRTDIELSQLTVERFLALREEINETLHHTKNNDGSQLYRVPLPQGGFRYLRVESTWEEGHCVGLAEDVTVATLERLRIEHDRDYDLLTGLLNRRAFYRELELLFQAPEKLGCTAVMMLDLDNLKSINDRFGHDWGDQYIRRAGQCFLQGVPTGTLCARVSGDEFFLIFSGYPDKETARTAIAALGKAITVSQFLLPSGEDTHIRASGGVAWYPEDSRNYQDLIKFADFAMYQMKKTQKGQVGEFDLGVYNQESFLNQTRLELAQVLQEERISYHFQPIFDAKTGRVRAYEALMRVHMPTLRSPDAVLRLAKEQGQLAEVERLTWFKANDAFQALREQQAVDEEANLFINSIASQCLTMEDQALLQQRHDNLLSRVVIEITEDEDMNASYTAIKRTAFGRTNRFALDDYGSGYNSEKKLLELSPQFIKVDISIIRDIDKDTNKQKILSNVVSYGHERGMEIVAEGLETAGEVEQTLELGADLLQGYFLARPGAVPPELSSAAQDLIATHWLGRAQR